MECEDTSSLKHQIFQMFKEQFMVFRTQEVYLEIQLISQKQLKICREDILQMIHLVAMEAFLH